MSSRVSSSLSLSLHVQATGRRASAACRTCVSSGAECIVSDLSIRCARCVRWHFGCSLSSGRRRDLLARGRSFVRRRLSHSSRRAAAASAVLAAATAAVAFWDAWDRRLSSSIMSNRLLSSLVQAGFGSASDLLEGFSGGSPITRPSSPSLPVLSPVTPVGTSEGSVTNPSPTPAVESTPASCQTEFAERG